MTPKEFADELLDAIDEAKRIPKLRIATGDLLGFRNDLQRWKAQTKRLIRSELGRESATSFEDIADLDILGPTWPYLEEAVRKYEAFLNDLSDHVREQGTVPGAPVSSATSPDRTIQAFCSYASKDAQFQDELETHLAVLKRERKLHLWNFRMLEPGVEWDAEIRKHLAAAELVLLLVSPDFLASRYSWEEELQYALKRHQEKRARVIPVILRPCEWQNTVLSRLQALPAGGKAVTSFPDRDIAWNEVAQGIRRVIETLRAAPAPSVAVSLTDTQKEILSAFAKRRIRAGEGMPINVLIGIRNLGVELDGLMTMGLLKAGQNNYVLLTAEGEQIALRADE